MPAVRAKFYVAEIHKFPGHANVILRVVTRGAVNASFASATPTGTIEMTISNPAALAVYEAHLGREMYVDFTPYHPEPGDGHAYVDSPEGHYNHGRCAECSGLPGEH